MPQLNSSRLLIGQGLQAFLTTVMNGSSVLYPIVKLGAVWNPSASGVTSNWVEVKHRKGVSKPAGSGGNQVGWRIDDQITWRIGSGFVYEVDSTAAETAMLTAMDILLPILHQHPLLPLASNPTQAIASVYSVLEDMPDESQPVVFPDGHVYLMWNCYVLVKQQFNVSLVVP